MKLNQQITRLGYQGIQAHFYNAIAAACPALFKTRPYAIDIYPTQRCNLKCGYCFCAQSQAPQPELSLDQWKHIIAGGKRWLGFYAFRIFGGEPLVRKDDVLELIRFAHELSLMTTLSSNGMAIDENCVRALVANGLDLLAISLDSLHADVFDRLRGAPGTFQKVRQVINRLQGHIAIQINTLITQDNIDELPDIVRFCDANNCAVSFQGLRDQRSGVCDTDAPLWPKDRDQVDKSMATLIQMKKKGHRIANARGQLERMRAYYLDPGAFYAQKNGSCQAHRFSFRIKSDGAVSLCSCFEPVGNATEQTLREIWHSRAAADIQGRMKKCNKNCSFIRAYYYENFREKSEHFRDIFLKSGGKRNE